MTSQVRWVWSTHILASHPAAGHLEVELAVVLGVKGVLGAGVEQRTHRFVAFEHQVDVACRTHTHTQLNCGLLQHDRVNPTPSRSAEGEAAVFSFGEQIPNQPLQKTFNDGFHGDVSDGDLSSTYLLDVNPQSHKTSTRQLVSQAAKRGGKKWKIPKFQTQESLVLR